MEPKSVILMPQQAKNALKSRKLSENIEK